MLRRRLFVLLAAFGSLLFTGCSTDFDITADYKEVTVVFGLLDVNDQVHYIRIQKAYLDEQTNALTQAQEPDSIYYPDILNVTVTESGTNKVFNLERINADTLPNPIIKDSGTFAQSPNILYRFAGNLDANRTYSLKVENTLTGSVATSQTELVNDFNVTRPFDMQEINFVGPSDFFAFWSLAQDGRIHDLTIRLHYSVAPANDPGNKTHQEYVDWPVFKNQDYLEVTPRYNIPGSSFYQGIQSFLDPEPNTVRYFDSLDFRFVVGTPTFSDYVSFNQASTGITQNLATTNFSNIKNGLGLFTSRIDKVITGVGLTAPSIDTLGCGSATGDLGFAPSPDPQKYPNYPFCN